MTIINDTRVVRLQRTAARTGHQHSADERIVESVSQELVTAAEVVSLPPGSLITLQRGPGSGHTEEGSVLNAAGNDIGGVAGGQTTSVSFNSEDGDVTANAVFQTEIDFSQTLNNPGEYAVNYKTFQIKTYTPVPTGSGQRTQVTYIWAPIREYLEWDPEDLYPDLAAFGVGPHQAGGGGGGGDAYVEAGCNIIVEEDGEYKIVTLDIDSLTGEGIFVEHVDGGCPKLYVDLDAYQIGYDDTGNRYIFADNVQDAIAEIDGYLSDTTRVEAGCNVIVDDVDGYKVISLDLYSFAGEGLVVDISGECPRLIVDIDAYQVGYDDTGNQYIFADNVQDAIREIDGYLSQATSIRAGCNIIVEEDDGYVVTLDIDSIAGEGLVVDDTLPCPRLKVDIDAYQVGYDDSGNQYIFADNVQDAITEIDGYLSIAGARHIRKLGQEADDFPTNTIFSLDGYEYPIGQDRVLVYVNGIAQFSTVDYVERSTTSIELADLVDNEDVVDIMILPGSLGGGFGGTTDFQNAYDNSPSGAKNLNADDGQITITQPAAIGSALRLISSGSITPTLVLDQGGTGEAARFKSIDSTKSTLLLQQDTVARNTVVNTAIVERSTSHVIGSQTGIGSGFLTRLENTGGSLFGASRVVTGTISATDSAERTYLSIELSDEGVLSERFRFKHDGSLGVNTNAPTSTLHVHGDGYFLEDLEVGEQVKINNTPMAPINVPVLNQDPPVLSHGDIWITNTGGIKKINIRIDGVTYSVQIT